MKKIISVFGCSIFLLGFGCARVRLEAPKEPIKMDISMRLDVYQHVVSDIDAIEGIVSGAKDKTNPKDKRSALELFIGNAYAQEVISPETEQAALRRRDRINELRALETKGVIGENRVGLVEVKDSAQATGSVKQLIEAENTDRMIIYQSVSVKNNISVDEVQKLYAKRLRSDAPFGTPIEVLNEASGVYEWKVK